MASAARKILDDALALSPDERLEIAAELMASVDGASDPDWEQAWAAELERRTREADASGDRAAGAGNRRPEQWSVAVQSESADEKPMAS